jgi:hypothetical protein
LVLFLNDNSQHLHKKRAICVTLNDIKTYSKRLYVLLSNVIFRIPRKFDRRRCQDFHVLD